jgi:hypothetical protein
MLHRLALVVALAASAASLIACGGGEDWDPDVDATSGSETPAGYRENRGAETPAGIDVQSDRPNQA